MVSANAPGVPQLFRDVVPVVDITLNRNAWVKSRSAVQRATESQRTQSILGLCWLCVSVALCRRTRGSRESSGGQTCHKVAETPGILVLSDTLRLCGPVE